MADLSLAASTAVLDTDVWSHLFSRQRSSDPRVPRWREVLFGRSVTIAVQTRAEVLAGALGAGWGQSKMTTLRANLDRTATLGVDHEVAEVYATLTAELTRSGHALHQKVHVGDRWVAATAITHGLPLLAGDGIYAGTPGLKLLNEPP